MVTGDQYHAVLAREQLYLWTDLHNAIRRAINCVWSIEAEGLRERILDIARLVGPTSWRDVPCEMLTEGHYQQVLDDAGIDYDPPDMLRVEAVIANRYL